MRTWLSSSLYSFLLLVLSACAPAATVVLPSATLPLTATTTPSPTRTLAPSATATATTATATPLPAIEVCSPLAGYALEDLPGLISNSFNPPQPGSDLPHQGIDLSLLDPATRIALTGHPVQAVLPGTVAMVISNRFPYGNALLVETPMEAGYEDWWAAAGMPAPAPTLKPRSALTCPAFSQPPAFHPTRRSVYVLYAHLDTLETFTPAQEIACGQPLGSVGMSGNALNPHLHIEIRAAPAGIQFGSMAHYDASAGPDEMAAYCLWRISGLFQLVNPMQVFLR